MQRTTHGRTAARVPLGPPTCFPKNHRTHQLGMLKRKEQGYCSSVGMTNDVCWGDS